MPKQLDMFGGEPETNRPTPTGRQLARVGIDQVLANESDEWTRRTLQALYAHAQQHAELFSDDLYEYEWMPFPPHHHNAVGGLWRRARELGILSDATRFVYSTRPEAHSRRVFVYQSLVFRPSH